MHLHGQRKINRENPFVLAFRKIYIPRKLPRIRYTLSVQVYRYRVQINTVYAVIFTQRYFHKFHELFSICEILFVN